MEKDKIGLNYALKLLSRRWYTTFEIRQKLLAKQNPEDETEKIVQFLTSKKFLDDERFATSFIKDHQTFRYEGKIVINQKLYKKGIGQDLVKKAWDNIAQENQDKNSELEAAKQAILSKKRSYQKLDPQIVNRRLMSFLTRKGFSYDTIKKALAISEDEIYN